MIQQAHDASLELLVTLCIPTTGFALANHLKWDFCCFSNDNGGIIIGNWSRHDGFSPENGKNMDHFWHLIDEYLNALLFLLIGLSLVLIKPGTRLVLMALAIPLVLTCRYISVFRLMLVKTLSRLLSTFFTYPHGVATWRSCHSHGFISYVNRCLLWW